MLCEDGESSVELRNISEVECFSEYPKWVPLVLVRVVPDCGIVALSALDAPASSFQPRFVVEICAEQVLVLMCQWSVGDDLLADTRAQCDFNAFDTIMDEGS